MPRNVRPSFISVDVDGRASSIETGPKARNGDLSALLSVRDRGEVLDLLYISASANGKTVTVQVFDKRDKKEIFCETFQQ